MIRRNLQHGMAALILALMGLATFQVSASAEAIDVRVCGKIAEFSPVNSGATGTLVIGGDHFVLPTGAVVDDEIELGNTGCLTLTFDATGRLVRVAGEAESPGAAASEDDRWESRSEPPARAEEHTTAPAEAQQTNHAISGGDQGELPVTGGSAPSGPLYAVVSLATVLLAGFGVFSARRGI